jgi:DNA-binding SARP family transcriptional activator/predicted ATPase
MSRVRDGHHTETDGGKLVMMPEFHITLFGDFRIRDSNTSIVTLTQTRQQALVVYLLLHRAVPQSRPHVAFLLWPDSSEAQALTNLRKTLTQLRQAAPVLAQAIYADHKAIQWQPAVPFTLDVDTFEAQLAQAHVVQQAGRHGEALGLLAAAVDRYAGPLVPSCYDDWILSERERLHQLCLQALAQLATLSERQGELATAIRYAQHLLRLDPLQETIYLQLMRLQALQGDRASALRTYHTCATVLERELGVEPERETQAAYARLLNLERSTVGTRTALRRTQGVSTFRLIGRQPEWQQLQAAWRLATEQRAYCVCLLGEAGIGKTHLAEELLTWASHQGFAVARTRAYAGEDHLAYAPIVEWLRAKPIHMARKQLAPVWLSEVARLVPEILTEQPLIPPPEPVTERWQRQRFWEALARALLTAPQPLLLLVDDLHWCDTETLEWLRYLLHFAPRARLLVLGSARPEELTATHPLHAFLRHLRSAEQLTTLELSPLDVEQTAALADQTAGQSLSLAAHQAVYHTTAGNPLFVVETVRTGSQWSTFEEHRSGATIRPAGELSGCLPPKIQAVIQSRLAHLSPAGRDLVWLAASIGRAFTFDVLVQASGADKDDVMQALDELWQRRIIREQGATAYDFSHDRIRDVAYAEISPVRRRQLHGHIAMALEKIHATTLDIVSDALAFHYEQARVFEQAVVYYLRAAEVAQARYAYSEAITALQHALGLLTSSLPITPETKGRELHSLIALVHLLRETKGYAAPEVAEMFNQALALCRLVGDKAQLYGVQNGLSMYYLNRSEFALARQFAADNLILAQELEDQKKLQDSHTCIGFIQLDTAEFASALKEFEQTLTLSVSCIVPNQVEEELQDPLGLATSALCLWLLGHPEQARQRTQQALTLLPRHPNPTYQVGTLEFTLIMQHCLHDTEELRTQAEQMATLAMNYGLAMYHAIGMIYTGFAQVQQGEPTAGLVQMQRGLDLVKQTHVILYLPFCLALLAEAYRQAGQTAQALSVVDEAISLAEQTGETWWQAELLHLRGQLLLATGAVPGDVEVFYQHAIQVARQQAAKSLELRAVTSLAHLWQQQGRFAEAYQMLAEIYGWFTEGFDTADLQTTQALLTALCITD